MANDRARPRVPRYVAFAQLAAGGSARCPGFYTALAQPWATNPEQEALLADSVGLAVLVVLDRLNPIERLAFVPHDMFAVSFEEISTIIGRSPAAARQLATRARRRVQGASPS